MGEVQLHIRAIVKSLAVSESEGPKWHLHNLPETIPVAGMDEAGSASSGAGRANLYICVLGTRSRMNGKEEWKS